jgi:hypothetical protein
MIQTAIPDTKVSYTQYGFFDCEDMVPFGAATTTIAFGANPVVQNGGQLGQCTTLNQPNAVGTASTKFTVTGKTSGCKIITYRERNCGRLLGGEEYDLATMKDKCFAALAGSARLFCSD